MVDVTKKVKYSPNERLDLVDKLAEDSLLDDTLGMYLSTLDLDGSPDGRVFFGWITSTVPGPNVGITFTAVPSAAVDRSGKVLLRKGDTALSAALSTNALNYVHAYYEEADSDVDARRFFSTVEYSNNTPTRLTRTCNIYVSTTPYGTGIPILANFEVTKNIGGIDRQLVPMFAVAVDGTDTIPPGGIHDFRPMFAPMVNGAGGNEYDLPINVPDYPHNFLPADQATIGIYSFRQALVAITDRLTNIKQTDWYSDFVGLNVGFTGTVDADTVKVGDANFKLDGSVGTTPQLVFDPTDFLQFERATNRYQFYSGTDGKIIDVQWLTIQRSGISINRPSILFSATNFLAFHRGIESFLANAKAFELRYTDATPTNIVPAFVTHRYVGSAVTTGTVLGGLGFGGEFSIGEEASGYDGGTFIEGRAAQDWTVANRGGHLLFFTTPNNTAVATEKMRITQNGRVGIGITTPAVRLHLYDAIETGAVFRLENSSAVGANEIQFKGFSDTNQWIIFVSNTINPTTLRFLHGATQWMQLRDQGFVLGKNDPSYPVDWQGGFFPELGLAAGSSRVNFRLTAQSYTGGGGSGDQALSTFLIDYQHTTWGLAVGTETTCSRYMTFKTGSVTDTTNAFVRWSNIAVDATIGRHVGIGVGNPVAGAVPALIVSATDALPGVDSVNSVGISTRRFLEANAMRGFFYNETTVPITDREVLARNAENCVLATGRYIGTTGVLRDPSHFFNVNNNCRAGVGLYTVVFSRPVNHGAAVQVTPHSGAGEILHADVAPLGNSSPPGLTSVTIDIYLKAGGIGAGSTYSLVDRDFSITVTGRPYSV